MAQERSEDIQDRTITSDTSAIEQQDSNDQYRSDDGQLFNEPERDAEEVLDNTPQNEYNTDEPRQPESVPPNNNVPEPYDDSSITPGNVEPGNTGSNNTNYGTGSTGREDTGTTGTEGVGSPGTGTTGTPTR